MAKKFKLGLNYFFDNKSNSGIVNYIYNIVAALNTLDDSDKPKIVLFYSKNAPLEYIKAVKYPVIEYVLFRPYPSNIIVSKLNTVLKKIIKKDVYKNFRYFNKIDSLYPYFDSIDYGFADFKFKIYWLVDFNNLAYPSYYDDKGELMIKIQQKITASKQRVILSSDTLFDELRRYYPKYKCDIKILRFASSLPELSELDVIETKKKYNIDVPYLMSPNQFWEHKNQSLVLDAINIIRHRKPDLRFKILFSGSLEVNRGKGYYIDLLQKKVEDYNLKGYLSFLGVLERQDQLLLMKGSSALLQPSLYEGWSTLVEEAKALNKFIILSDILVHKEQINCNADFFNPLDADDLAQKIVKQLISPSPITSIDYKENVKKFGKNIINSLTTLNGGG